MTLPTIEAYAKAIQNPANLALPLLRGMKVTRNSEGNFPRVWPGAFGVVFRFEKGDNSARAAKCFTQIFKTRAERYEAIANHLDRVFCRNSPITRFLVNSIYVPQGVRVDRQWYPLFLMDWVDAAFLHEHIAMLGGKPEAGILIAEIADQWIDLVLALQSNNIAHGDLQHGNVLVMPSGQMKLIDYDGMLVPALAKLRVMEGGHPNYQHPARSLHYDGNLDTFSALVILTALTAMSLKPDLWNQFNKGNNMLFDKSDFRTPHASPVFGALEQIQDSKLEYLVRELKMACTIQDTTSIKPFHEIIAPFRS